MPALLLVAPEPLAGKTTLAAGIARRAAAQGRPTVLERLPGGENEPVDRILFARLSADTPDLRILEGPAGAPAAALAAQGDAAILAVLPATFAPDAAAHFCRPLAQRLRGVLINRVPRKRLDTVRDGLRSAGLNVVALVPEDRTLAAPTLGQIAEALHAHPAPADGLADTPAERPLIAPIAVDPGQAYFAYTGAATIIVRSDKPDLQLGALNAGTNCLIITGNAPLLPYVRHRADAEGATILRTPLGTVETVAAIEGLFAATPFAGGDAKLRRAEELLGDLDIGLLAGSAA